MSDPNQNEPVEANKVEPLSPEAQAMFAKARRSFGISIGILLLGFMAIGFALVYRVMRDKPPAEMAAEVSLPAGAEILSSVVSDGMVNVTHRENGVVSLSLFDQGTGALVRSIELVAK
ncbi:DUF6476 family protein [Devosia sp.]|uniref:DUF6476 family protein n=1 Tax=Devosia sp. TaxID=1871048 RepID=UPI0032662ADC